MDEQEKIKVWWDEKEEVLRVKLIGDQDEETANKLIREMAAMSEKHPEKLLILNDMTQAGKPTVGARKIMIRETNPDRIEKIAFFGGNLLIRIIISFVMASSGVSQLKIFKTEEKALKWLKEKK